MAKGLFWRLPPSFLPSRPFSSSRSRARSLGRQMGKAQGMHDEQGVESVGEGEGSKLKSNPTWHCNQSNDSISWLQLTHASCSDFMNVVQGSCCQTRRNCGVSTFRDSSSKWMAWMDLFSEFIHMPKKWIMRNKKERRRVGVPE